VRENLLFQELCTDDPEAMADFNEEYSEDIYSHAEILTKFKAEHALAANGKSQKSVADKARADKAALANAQIHLNSGRYPSHEDFVKQFEEINGRKPNEKETIARHTENARNLMHYWHENQDAFIGTEAQGKFEEKIQDYLNNGADFKELSEDIQNMEAQGIDLGDRKARDKYYEKKSYDEKQPQLSAKHHAERLHSALKDGHHDRRTAFDTETGEAYSGHMRLGKDGEMEMVRSDEAARDGGEIQHAESPNAPQVQHHKADGTLDEEAQALYQKAHEARQGMSRDEHAHINALENENSEHKGRIKEHQDAHDVNLETSEQGYQGVKRNVDTVRKMNEERAARTHEGGLKQHAQEHESWESEIAGHELAHATEEKRFANTESNIHKNHETDTGQWDDWAAREHESLEDEKKAIPQKYAEKRKELQETHENERTDRQDQHDDEIQNARNTFEEKLRETPDFRDMSQDDPIYQQEIQSQIQSLRDQHEQEYEAQTTRQRSEQAGLDSLQDEEEKAVDQRHRPGGDIDEQKDREQELIGNNTTDALEQNTSDNQEQYDGIVSSINARRDERGDPRITEGLTRGQRGGAGILDIAAVEREAHDQSYKAGIATLQSKRDANLQEIREKGEAQTETAKKAKAQKDSTSSDALIAAYKDSAKQRDANRAQLEAARPEKVSARTKATEEADTAFSNHMGQVDTDDESLRTVINPETGEKEVLPEGSTINPYTEEPLGGEAFRIGNAEGHARASHALQNPELGATSEKKKEAHDEDQEGEDRDGKPQQTRMVDDTANPGQKKQQVWIPGRGKGWVDKDKMNDAMGLNADAAGDTSSHPSGKVVIYPPGHFNAGSGTEGEEGYEAPSQAMVGHGGNLHAVADKHIHPDDPAVAAMGHDDYIANHLAGRLEGHDFSAGVNSDIDAAGLGLHTSDHPATKSSKQRRFDQGTESAKKLGSQWGAKFKEGLEGGTPDEVEQKKVKEAAEKAAKGPPGAVQRLASQYLDYSSGAASTLSGQTRAFRGATNWLASQGIGEALAGGMRDARLGRSQAPKKGAFGRYLGESGYKPSLSSEAMRLPGLRHLRSSSMVIDHDLEDEKQRISNLALLDKHVQEQAAKLESRRTGKS